MKYSYGNSEIEVIVIRKNNRNTYIRIKDGKIVVTTGYLTKDAQIKKLLEEYKDNIDRMLGKKIGYDNLDSSFRLFGKKYEVVFREDIKGVMIENDRILVRSNEDLEKFLKSYVSKVFANHLEYWYNRFEENLPSCNLKIRKMKSRWGVCNLKNKNVTLNYELYKYDIECLDYVIVHELSHFCFPNHQKGFWDLVAKYYPNWKENRKKLRSS